MQSFVDFRIVYQFTTGTGEAAFGNRAIAHNLRLRTEIESSRNFAMAHNFTGATTVCTERGFGSLAGFTDALAITTGTIDLAIDAIRAWNRLAFVGRIGIHRIWNRHALLANPLENIRDFFIDSIC